MSVRSVAMGVTLGTLVACSPYIYKSEIAEFGTGVKDVAAAYDDGMKAYAQERSDRQELEWRFARAKLAKTRGCDIGIGPGAVFKEPCELRPTGNSAGEGGADGSVLPRTRLELVKPLSRYAAALVAVTNAKDREELIAAQANLKTSIDGLTTEVGLSALPMEPLSAIARASLDQERYETLKRSVVAADPYIAKVGAGLGITLDTLRGARADELNRSLEVTSRTLSPTLLQATYDARLEVALRDRDAIEALRLSNPTKAADDMVTAHHTLAEALTDDQRQISSVMASIREFYDEAAALQKAFAKAGGS